MSSSLSAARSDRRASKISSTRAPNPAEDIDAEASVSACIFWNGGMLSVLISQPEITSSTPTAWPMAWRAVQSGHSDCTVHSSSDRSAHRSEISAKQASVVSIRCWRE